MSQSPSKLCHSASEKSACRVWSSSIDTSCLSPAARQRLETSPRNGYIRIKIQYGNIFQLFDMKRDIPLRSVLRKFAQKINQEPAFLRFHSEDTRIKETDTPASLGMDDLDILGNVIDVSVMQTGG
ncbi:hypothetical protein DFH09DRAFT_187020 [Mycena vulgaris]|nr:hypothetical protein DFH09DRAFT_187020 [Mycena vulgaris]